MKVPVVSSVSRKRGFSIVGLVVRVMPIFIAATAIVFGCISTAALRAQDSPVMGVSHLDGDWRSVDPNTSSFAEIVIEGKNIHPYGACHPTACDWGVFPAKSFGANVRSSYPVALLAEKNNGFSQVWIAVRLGDDEKLRVETFTHFTDGSRRADYSTVDYFERGRRPYTP
jgi:hypothetical protein